ncbi:MAG: DUF4013 domain-containing protein [Planctomycetes bacterium]|nr:DUF4013 domain-containing protein [Planctomycetota bacterium]
MPDASYDHESIPAKPLQPSGTMEYMRSFHYVFENPNWVTNILFTGLCFLSTSVIPVIGQLVIQGYQFEILEALHRNPGTQYPDFDMNKLLDYLLRGFWVFLVSLVVVLVLFVVFFGLFVLGGAIVGGAGAAAGDDGAGIAIAVVGLIVVLIAFPIGIAAQMIMVPLMLRAGLTQDFGSSFDIAFVKQFIRNTWMEMILSGLFLALAGLLLYIVGAAMLCIGIFFTMSIAMLMQAHLGVQLYELHLARGGDPILMKPPTA